MLSCCYYTIITFILRFIRIFLNKGFLFCFVFYPFRVFRQYKEQKNKDLARVSFMSVHTPLMCSLPVWSWWPQLILLDFQDKKTTDLRQLSWRPYNKRSVMIDVWSKWWKCATVLQNTLFYTKIAKYLQQWNCLKFDVSIRNLQKSRFSYWLA